MAYSTVSHGFNDGLTIVSQDATPKPRQLAYCEHEPRGDNVQVRVAREEDTIEIPDLSLVPVMQLWKCSMVRYVRVRTSLRP